MTASSPLNHATDVVRLAGNPYAAMPSLHAADALIVGVSLALLVRPLWLKGAVASLAVLGRLCADGER